MSVTVALIVSFVAFALSVVPCISHQLLLAATELAPLFIHQPEDQTCPAIYCGVVHPTSEEGQYYDTQLDPFCNREWVAPGLYHLRVLERQNYNFVGHSTFFNKNEICRRTVSFSFF